MTRFTSAVVGAATIALASNVHAALVYSNDFETSAVDARPLGFAAFNPAANVSPNLNSNTAGSTGPLGILTTGPGTANPVPNLAGTGNAMRLFDHNTADAANAVTTSFSPLTQGVLSLNFSSTPLTAETGNSFMRIVMGNNGAGTFNPSSGSAAQVRVDVSRTGASTTGVVGYSGSTTGINIGPGSTPFPLQTSNLIRVFFNQSTNPVQYLEGSTVRTLGQKTFDIWLNGNLLTSTPFNYLTATNVNAFGFSSGGGGQAGADWVIDNISLRNDLPPVPEPTTLAGLALSATLVLRRRVRGS